MATDPSTRDRNAEGNSLEYGRFVLQDWARYYEAHRIDADGFEVLASHLPPLD